MNEIVKSMCKLTYEEEKNYIYNDQSLQKIQDRKIYYNTDGRIIGETTLEYDADIEFIEDCIPLCDGIENYDEYENRVLYSTITNENTHYYTKKFILKESDSDDNKVIRSVTVRCNKETNEITELYQGIITYDKNERVIRKEYIDSRPKNKPAIFNHTVYELKYNDNGECVSDKVWNIIDEKFWILMVSCETIVYPRKNMKRIICFVNYGVELEFMPEYSYRDIFYDDKGRVIKECTKLFE